MKVQYIIALLSAATAVVAAPVPGRAVCHVRQQKIVTIVHTAYEQSASPTPTSAPTPTHAPKKEEPISITPSPSPKPIVTPPPVVEVPKQEPPKQEPPKQEQPVVSQPVASKPVASKPAEQENVPAKEEEAVYKPEGTAVDKSTSTIAPPTTTAPAGGQSKRVGWASWYNVGQGSCGSTDSDGDMVAAVGWNFFDRNNIDGNSNNNPLCGKTVQCKYKGKTATFKIVDRCTKCNDNDIDLSPAIWTALGEDKDKGILNDFEWEIL